ncbi:MAG: hypothetical protein RLZ98_2563 [Pseudomonadota bacterium]
MDIPATKARMRIEARDRRSRLDASERAAAATALATQDLSFLGSLTGRTVAGYAAIGSELDPRPLLARMAREGAELALPRISPDRTLIAFHSWQPGDAMDRGVWGIAEPQADAAMVEPGILLVPLLAFDRQGWRLGYGAGYYDRAIAHLRADAPIVAVGLAFASQEVDAVPHMDYDQHLDWVLTPDAPLKMAV